MASAREEAVSNNSSSKPAVKPFDLFRADLALRLLLFATTLVPLVLLLTSKQTVLIPVPFSNAPLALNAKFTYSSALIYYVAAMSVACLYSLITAIATALAIYAPFPSAMLVFLFGSLDALMVGVAASATGAATSIAYIGLRGNSHVGWSKVCNIYTKFCRHVGVAIIVSLVASIILVLLSTLSTYTLYHRSRHLR